MNARARWEAAHPDSRNQRTQAYRDAHREELAIKRVARYHGISFQEAKERREAFRARHRRDVAQLSKEKWS